jgi:hypothetical protein
MKIKFGLLLIVILLCTSSIEAKQKDDTITVHGRVTDNYGEPLEGAAVQFFARYGYHGTDIRLIKSVVTDAEGNYSVTGISYPGAYMVFAECKGFKNTEISRVFLSKGKNLLDIVLEVGAVTDVGSIEIKGTVSQADKTPLQDATVTVISIFTSELVRQARTDKNGNYKFSLSPLGQYVIYVSKSGFAINATAAYENGKETNFILMPARVR